jgi:hypothetical protein
MDEVIWGIFWKVFWRSCGPPTRSVGPIDGSARLLVGQTHLSGTAVSLVGGDPWVSMSHMRGGAPGRGLYAAPPNGRIQWSGGATSTIMGRGG